MRAKGGGDWLTTALFLAQSVKLHTNQGENGLFRTMYDEIAQSLGFAIKLDSFVVHNIGPTGCPQLDNSFFQNKRHDCRVPPQAEEGGPEPWHQVADCGKVYLPMMSGAKRRGQHVTCQSFYQERPVSGRARCEQADDGIRDEWMRRFAVVREWLLRWANVPSERDFGFRRVVMVQVRTADPSAVAYFVDHKQKGGTRLYGSHKRNVTNLSEVAERLRRDRRLAVRVAAPDGLSLREQIRMHHDLEVFVWGHGAGMVHMLWMRPSGLAIEISPARESESYGLPVPPHHGGALIAEAASLQHRDVWVESEHGPVDVREVELHVQRWLSKQ